MRAGSSDVRWVSDVRRVICRTSETCRMFVPFDKSLYSRGHLEDPFVGRPSGFGRPSCRTSELERTSVVFVSLCKGSTSSSPPMSDVRNVSDVRNPSVRLRLLEPELLLLDPCLCLGCPHQQGSSEESSSAT